MKALATELEPIAIPGSEQVKEALRQHYSHTSFLDDIIFSDKPIKFITEYLLAFIAGILGIDYAEYRTLNELGNKLELTAVYNRNRLSTRPYKGRRSVFLSPRESPASTAFHKPYGAPEYCSHLFPETYRIAPQLMNLGIQSVYALSVRTAKTAFGVITLFDVNNRKLEDFEPCMVQAKAKSLALSLRSRQDRAKLRQTSAELEDKVMELEIQLATDPLTGVGSRRSFEHMLEKSKTLSNLRPQVLIFADLDYFKAVNDTHGHHVGDRVLREIAQCIKDHLRPNDHIWKTGGEEFGIVLENIDNIEYIIKVLKVIRFQLQTLPPPNVTLSFGLTFMTGNPDEDKVRADNALYIAKRAGRNTAVFYDIPERGGTYRQLELV